MLKFARLRTIGKFFQIHIVVYELVRHKTPRKTHCTHQPISSTFYIAVNLYAIFRKYAYNKYCVCVCFFIYIFYVSSKILGISFVSAAVGSDAQHVVTYLPITVPLLFPSYASFLFIFALSLFLSAFYSSLFWNTFTVVFILVWHYFTPCLFHRFVISK